MKLHAFLYEPEITHWTEISNFTTKGKTEQDFSDRVVDLVRCSWGPNKQHSRIWVQSLAKVKGVERLAKASVSKRGLAALAHGSAWCWSVTVCGRWPPLSQARGELSVKLSTDQSLLTVHKSAPVLWQKGEVSSYQRNQAAQRSAANGSVIFRQ